MLAGDLPQVRLHPNPRLLNPGRFLLARQGSHSGKESAAIVKSKGSNVTAGLPTPVPYLRSECSIEMLGIRT